MSRNLLVLLASILLAVSASAITFGDLARGLGPSPTRGTPIPPVSMGVMQTTGNQTNVTELARFDALLGDAGAYDALKSTLDSYVATVPDALPNGTYSGEGSVCDHTSLTTYDLREAAKFAFGSAMKGYIDTNILDQSRAKFVITDFQDITDFEQADLSGSNECILIMSQAVGNLIEAALLLEESNYVSWHENDRTDFGEWLHDEVWPLVTWAAGPDGRKNNWGIEAEAAAVQIAGYLEYQYATITPTGGSAVAPATYYADNSRLTRLLSRDVGDVMDGRCTTPNDPSGMRTDGGLPEELRRTDDEARCQDTDLLAGSPAACASSTSCTAGSGWSYSDRYLAALAKRCEFARRKGDTSCFEWTAHGGDDTALIDGIQFVHGTTYDDIYMGDATWGPLARVVAQYEASWDLYDGLTDGATDAEDGDGYSWTAITHANGVSYETPLTAPVASWEPEFIGLDDDFEGRTGSTDAALRGTALPGGARWDTSYGGLLEIKTASSLSITSPVGDNVLSVGVNATTDSMMTLDLAYNPLHQCYYTTRWIRVKTPSSDWFGVHGHQGNADAASENFWTRVLEPRSAGTWKAGPQYYANQDQDGFSCDNTTNVGHVSGNLHSQDPVSVANNDQSETATTPNLETNEWFYEEIMTCSMHDDNWDPEGVDGNGASPGKDGVSTSADWAVEIPVRTYLRYWKTDGTLRFDYDEFRDQGSGAGYIGVGPGRKITDIYDAGGCIWANALSDHMSGNNGQAGVTLVEDDVILYGEVRTGSSDTQRPLTLGASEPWWPPSEGFPDAP